MAPPLAGNSEGVHPHGSPQGIRSLNGCCVRQEAPANDVRTSPAAALGTLPRLSTTQKGASHLSLQRRGVLQTIGMPNRILVCDCLATYLTVCTPLKANATQRADRYYAEIVATSLGELAIADLAPIHVDALHRQLGMTEGRKVLANRVLSFVSQLTKLAERQGHRAANTNPTTAIRRYSEFKRTVHLREGQRAPFLQACRDSVTAGDVPHSAALLVVLMLLGGLRWSEARELQWSEVRLEQGTIVLRARGDGREANKGGEEDTVPISDDLVAVLRESPRFGRWVAPNRASGLPYTDIRKPFRRICTRAGVKITPHALRHTFGSALADAGLTVPEIAACMRHRSEATTNRYIHLSGSVARKALLRGASRIRGAA